MNRRPCNVAVLFVLGSATACSSVQRQAVGGTVTALGAVTTVAGGAMLDPCGAGPANERAWCRENHQPRNEQAGNQIAAVDLGTMLVGSIIYLSGTRFPHRPKPGPWHFSHSAPQPAGSCTSARAQGTMKTPFRSSVAEMYVRPVLPFLPVVSRHETARN